MDRRLSPRPPGVLPDRPRLGRLAAHYFRFNLSASMAYSTSFLVQVFGMALNNGAFVIFWLVLFEQIGGEIAGYGFEQVMFLWSLAASGSKNAPMSAPE